MNPESKEAVVQVTIPEEHAQAFRFMVAEQVLADEELIERAAVEWPSADTSRVEQRLAYYRGLQAQCAATEGLMVPGDE